MKQFEEYRDMELNFRSDDYQILLDDLVKECFYIPEKTNRGIIANIRQLAEVYVRKLLDLEPDQFVTLGNKKIVEKLTPFTTKNPPLLNALENLRILGNECTHTQNLENVTDEDLSKSKESLLYLHSYLFVNFFENYKFGSNKKIISSFSILPPILRFLVLEQLFKTEPDNLDIIDKLSLASLKAFNLANAKAFLQKNKLNLEKLPTINEEGLKALNSEFPPLTVEQIINNAPENMYVLCLERVDTVNAIIQKNNPAYLTFEDAMPLYQKKGIINGTSKDILSFNELMKFSYLGRKPNGNLDLDSLSNYQTIQ